MDDQTVIRQARQFQNARLISQYQIQEFDTSLFAFYPIYGDEGVLFQDGAANNRWASKFLSLQHNSQTYLLSYNPEDYPEPRTQLYMNLELRQVSRVYPRESKDDLAGLIFIDESEVLRNDMTEATKDGFLQFFPVPYFSERIPFPVNEIVPPPAPVEQALEEEKQEEEVDDEQETPAAHGNQSSSSSSDDDEMERSARSRWRDMNATMYRPQKINLFRYVAVAGGCLWMLQAVAVSEYRLQNADGIQGVLMADEFKLVRVDPRLYDDILPKEMRDKLQLTDAGHTLPIDMPCEYPSIRAKGSYDNTLFSMQPFYQPTLKQLKTRWSSNVEIVWKLHVQYTEYGNESKSRKASVRCEENVPLNIQIVECTFARTLTNEKRRLETMTPEQGTCLIFYLTNKSGRMHQIDMFQSLWSPFLKFISMQMQLLKACQQLLSLNELFHDATVRLLSSKRSMTYVSLGTPVDADKPWTGLYVPLFSSKVERRVPIFQIRAGATDAQNKNFQWRITNYSNFRHFGFTRAQNQTSPSLVPYDGALGAVKHLSAGADGLVSYSSQVDKAVTLEMDLFQDQLDPKRLGVLVEPKYNSSYSEMEDAFGFRLAVRDTTTQKRYPLCSGPYDENGHHMQAILSGEMDELVQPLESTQSLICPDFDPDSNRRLFFLMEQYTNVVDGSLRQEDLVPEFVTWSHFLRFISGQETQKPSRVVKLPSMEELASMEEVVWTEQVNALQAMLQDPAKLKQWRTEYQKAYHSTSQPQVLDSPPQPLPLPLPPPPSVEVATPPEEPVVETKPKVSWFRNPWILGLLVVSVVLLFAAGFWAWKTFGKTHPVPPQRASKSAPPPLPPQAEKPVVEPLKVVKNPPTFFNADASNTSLLN